MIIAEAKAILAATDLVKEERESYTIVSDGKMVVDAINSDESSWPWECAGIIAAIMDVLNTSPRLRVIWKKRDHVSEADMIASLARENWLPLDWLVTLF
ncbi:hypothetical protein LINPERHAP1_LOCUS9356 [Linum perenne]